MEDEKVIVKRSVINNIFDIILKIFEDKKYEKSFINNNRVV